MPLDIRSNDLLRGLTPAELELVLPHLERRQYAAGQTIVDWGEPGEHLYVIESGLVSVTLPSRGGDEVVLGQLGPGQIFGEMAIVTGQPRSASVRALVNTVVATLSVSSFFKVAGRSPTLLLNIGRVMAERLAHMYRTTSLRERRAVVALVGPVPTLVGSLIATNLAVALALVSGRRPVLLDAPAERAAALPGREWSPGLEEIRAGEQALLHLSELAVGSVKLHVVTLPSPDESIGAEARGAPERGGAGMVVRAIGRLARAAEFVVVNLTGAPSAMIDEILPMASVVHLVATTSLANGDHLASLARRCRRRLEPGAKLEMIALAVDGSSASEVRSRMQAVTGIGSCEVLPGPADLLRTAARVAAPMTLTSPWLTPSKVITRLARGTAGLRVGLALGGGSARGVAHVGVIAALDRLGVPIDVVTGTSVGSVVAAGVALGMDIRQIEESVNRMVDVWGATLRPTLSSLSLASPKALERVVRDVAGDARFDELAIPLGAVAADLNSGRAVYMCRGSVGQALRASISIPVVFPPLVVGEYVLVDGGVINPVPIDLARLLGADVVLACSLAQHRDDTGGSPLMFEPPTAESAGSSNRPMNMLRTYLRCMEIMTTNEEERDCLAADVTFRPRLPPLGWREFQKGGPPMLAGEQAVEDELERLRAVLPWLRQTA